jgi:tol-pal system protein YbgF
VALTEDTVAGGIFINYRRVLNRKDAQLLQNALRRHFGRREVFLDERNIDAGAHWLHELERQVDASMAMVALIGRGWADVADEKGNRRLDDPNDFVRFELARAFSRRIPVLPVLIDGAAIPDKAQLPANLLELTYRQAEHLRSETFDHDADRIAAKLRHLIAQSRPRGLSYAAAGAGAAAALALGIAVGPMLLSGLGLPLPGVVLPGGETLRADLAAARDGLQEARRERDDLLVTLQKQADAASREKAQSTAMLTAATKARDEALAEAKDAKADAEEWRQKHAALSGEARRKEEAAARERDGLRSELAASQRQLDAAKTAAAQPSSYFGSVPLSPGSPSALADPAPEPQQLYERAYGLVLQKDYGTAEAAFGDFLKRHPAHALAGSAQYWLGETFYARGQYQPAAAAFRKGYEDYPTAQKAQENLLRLTMSLHRLGQKDAACSLFKEFAIKFPNPPAHIKSLAQAEVQRSGC